MSEVAPSCPIPNAHRRLHECHRLWHAGAEAYADPDAFRTSLNALLQALRNVTFVLQQEKGAIPDFETWYERWRDIMGKDGVLKWLVESRNHVVHQGDLETYSTATAAIHASWDEPEDVTFEVPPLLPTLAIAARLSKQDIPEDVREGGFLRVERRWVARTLPEWELLDALGHCYGLLSLLISDAHRQAGSSMHAIAFFDDVPHEVSDKLAGRLPCMVASEAIRTVVLNLRTNTILEGTLVPGRPDDAAMQKAARRYGEMAEVPVPESTDPLDWAEHYMEKAKIVLARDKYHGAIAFLFRPDGSHHILSAGVPRDQQEKYLFMKDIADHVQRFGFTGIVFTTDAWMARAEDVPPGKRAGEVRERQEGLMVYAMRSDGATRKLTTPYTRRLGRIRFKETVEEEGTAYFLAPVMRVWGLDVPLERDAMAQTEARWREAHPDATD